MADPQNGKKEEEEEEAAVDELLFLIYQSVHGIFVSGGNSRKTLLHLQLRAIGGVNEGKDMWVRDFKNILTGIFSLVLDRCGGLIFPFSIPPTSPAFIPPVPLDE